MRPRNIELSNLKLQTKILQMQTIKAQLEELQTKVNAVEERLVAKETEVDTLEKFITQCQTSNVVTE